MHGVSLITTIAAGLGLALIFGMIAARLRLPALVGYLVAGVALGPATPGYVADLELTRQLAEIGVMLLMFGVGLHFSLDDLLEVRGIAVPGAIAKIAVSTALTLALTWAWGWSLGAGIVFGLALSVASTVVLIRALENRGVLDSVNGKIAVGWLVVEDVVMVLALVLLPAFAHTPDPSTAGAATAGSGIGSAVVWTLAKMSGFVLLMLVVGRRVFPWLLWQVARTSSRELFTLCVVAVAVGVAYGSAVLFGVSFALGAFFAGLLMGESALSHRAAEESLPMRESFAVLFFVSVGMLFDPHILLDAPLHVLGVVAMIMFGKSLVSFIIVLGFRYPLNSALTISAGLAQVGEFSFILAALGVSLGLLPEEGQSLLLAGAIVSIALNPLLFSAIEPAQEWIRKRSALARKLELSDDPLAALPMSVDPVTLTGHVVIVGYGRVGRRIAEALRARATPFVVVDENREIVEDAREAGLHAVAGDGAEPMALAQAHVARARVLVIATPDSVHARRMIEVARLLQPRIEIVVRTHSEEEAELLEHERAGKVFMGEHELALGMTRYVLERVAAG